MMKPMINWLKSTYATPSAEVMALRELESSKRRLLEAQTAREYAESMCKYREAQIKRLTAYLHNATGESK
jgi:hypothetical protein